LTASINALTGEIGINLFSTSPLTTPDGGSLVTIAFHVKPTAPAGPTSIHLAADVNPSGNRVIRTSLNDAQGGLVLHGVPTNPGNDVGGDERVTFLDEEPSGTPSGIAAERVTTAASLENPGVPNGNPVNWDVSETSVLDQSFQALHGSPLSTGALLPLPSRIDAAFASLLESVPVIPTVAVPDVSAFVLKLDESCDVPEWLPGLAWPLLDRRMLDRAADTQTLAESGNSSSAGGFSWEPDPVLGEAVEGLRNEQVP
jgi:hypothetical protein